MFNGEPLGGGVTYSSCGADDKKAIIISGNPNNEDIIGISGKKLETGPDLILMHELVGHGIPGIVGKDTDNAIDNENKVREEVKLEERWKDPQKDHVE